LVRPLALFDLDNTLIDRTAGHRRWAQEFCSQHGLGPDAVEWLCRADQDGFADRRVVFGAAKERYALAGSVEELVRQYRARFPEVFTPDAAVTRGLTSLRAAGWLLGVVTNGPASQRRKLEHAGLVDLVDACCVSSEIGWPKPDQRIFQAAVGRCGGDPTRPSTTWMVGDTADTDVLGAQAMGFRTIWLHRGRDWVHSEFAPEATADSLEEAVALLLEVVGGAAAQ
jgi:HAD superfamily hydrolase (TIGR01549 family)